MTLEEARYARKVKSNNNNCIVYHSFIQGTGKLDGNLQKYTKGIALGSITKLYYVANGNHFSKITLDKPASLRIGPFGYKTYSEVFVLVASLDAVTTIPKTPASTTTATSTTPATSTTTATSNTVNQPLQPETNINGEKTESKLDTKNIIVGSVVAAGAGFILKQLFTPNANS